MAWVNSNQALKQGMPNSKALCSKFHINSDFQSLPIMHSSLNIYWPFRSLETTAPSFTIMPPFKMGLIENQNQIIDKIYSQQTKQKESDRLPFWLHAMPFLSLVMYHPGMISQKEWTLAVWDCENKGLRSCSDSNDELDTDKGWCLI